MLTKNDLSQIRKLMGEELQQTSNELKELKEDIKTVDMKVELVSKKVDVLREDTAKGFISITDAIEENYKDLDVRVRKLDIHAGIPHSQ